METVNAESLYAFISASVEVSVHGGEEEDRGPSIKRTLKKLELCPDKTHLRIYFDNYFFLAVPLTNTVSRSDNEWTAYDEEARLYYSIKKTAV
ncbi:hypothetical protein [Bacillus piscicola]|uniref:hypothetical protein n=1 Tax=Bacillus piscicola TaxID=1632684 RepID=UPI001F0947AE|nr:hypothetical protein [Bacillus piscicola]